MRVSLKKTMPLTAREVSESASLCEEVTDSYVSEGVVYHLYNGLVFVIINIGTCDFIPTIYIYIYKYIHIHKIGISPIKSSVITNGLIIQC